MISLNDSSLFRVPAHVLSQTAGLEAFESGIHTQLPAARKHHPEFP
jgi:hypothetical protein